MSQDSVISESDERKLVRRFIEMEAQDRDASRETIDLTQDDDYPDDHEAMPDEPEWGDQSQHYIPPTPPQDTRDTGDHRNRNLIYGPIRRHDAIIVPGTSDRQRERKDGSFRMTAKKWLLTYSQADGLTKQAVAMKVSEKGPTKEWMVSEEWHEDGGTHFHCYVHYKNKLNIKSSTSFDITVADVVYHPNIQVVRNDKATKQYVCKYGNLISSIEDTFDWSTYHNFSKRRADQQAYKAALVFNRLDAIKWPIRLPDGTNQHKPSADERKRHFWIYGPADIGKTRWATFTFRNQKVFYPRKANKYPLEGYKDQEVLVFDDWDERSLVKDLLVDIANVYTSDGTNHVYGDTRFFGVFWAAHHVRTIIVLSNSTPTYSDEDWFKSRFYVMEITNEIVIDENM